MPTNLLINRPTALTFRMSMSLQAPPKDGGRLGNFTGDGFRGLGDQWSRDRNLLAA